MPMASLHSSFEAVGSDVEEQPSILHRARSSDFQFVGLVASGSQSSVFAVRCTLEGLPPNKLYALKMFYHEIGTTSWSDAAAATSYARSPSPKTAIDDTMTSQSNCTGDQKWLKRSRVLRHKNIVGILTWFEDTIEDDLWKKLTEDVKGTIEQSVFTRGGRRAQFVLFDLHVPLVVCRSGLSGDRPLPGDRPPPYAQAKKFAMQLLDALCFLRDHGIVHCDLKLEHLLMKSDGNLQSNGDIVLAGIGHEEYLYLKEGSQYIPCERNNDQHVAPEVHNQHTRPRSPWTEYAIDRQTSWAVGVLIYEFVMKTHPLPNYPIVYRIYRTRDGGGGDLEVVYDMEDVNIQPLPSEYLPEFNTLVMALLEPDPDKRPVLTDAQLYLEALHTSSADHLLQEVVKAQQVHEKLKENTSRLREENCVLEKRLQGHTSDMKQLQQHHAVLAESITELEGQHENLNVLMLKYETKPLAAVLKEISERRSDLRKRLIAINKEDTQDAAPTQLLCLDVEKLLKVMETAMARVSELQVLLERLPKQWFQTTGLGLAPSSRGISQPIPPCWKSRGTMQTAAGDDVTIDKEKLKAIGIAFAELQTVQRKCAKLQENSHELRTNNSSLSEECEGTEAACQTLRDTIDSQKQRAVLVEGSLATLHARIAEYDGKPRDVLSRDAEAMHSDLRRQWSTGDETNVQAEHELEEVYRLYELWQKVCTGWTWSHLDYTKWLKRVDRLNSLVKTSRQQLEKWKPEMVRILEVLTEMSAAVDESACQSLPKSTPAAAAAATVPETTMERLAALARALE
ncbi:uncharacterized protein LOC135813925 isoform X2 [Sycon ciliatum]|uniref:uncharacterized protein LOC135813925 isoform X2 n=1 Tax=Sycon ciliatum TaxID=27933 RepID=UPI0031F6A983